VLVAYIHKQIEIYEGGIKMYNFPTDLYTDIRIESIYSTTILYENQELTQNNTKNEEGAMIRIFDGVKWYYSSITDLDSIQAEIDLLAKMATPNPDILNHEVLKHLEVHKGTDINFSKECVKEIPNTKKVEMLKTYLPLLQECEEIKTNKVYYLDQYTKKHFISSLGSDITFDTQSCTVVLRYAIVIGNQPFNGGYDIYKTKFSDLLNHEKEVKREIDKDIDYTTYAVPVVPGTYTCLLSPMTAGVFAHESFGHKSEADFMIGDETMAKEWAIGTKVGSEILNIIDTGTIYGSGYVPYDDEGCRAKENYIIKDGILTGRLHSSYTAAAMHEPQTGNARAVSFEYEPIVRMTTTYIGAGTDTKEKLISEMKEGIYIEDILHGSGMSTFTIAPKKAYMIHNGEIKEPVKISVITGNVMETLNEIDGLSDTVEIKAFALGGCGKMEQFPLAVGFGGPYVRVNNIKVQ
jgi:TldD protein